MKMINLVIKNETKKESKETDEDNLWHELSFSRKLILERRINEYVNEFTVHGLPKILTGTKIERIFWSCILLCGIMSTFYVVYGLIEKYIAFGIYTEIRSNITSRNYFPSITFCENQLLLDSYFAYCGVAHRGKHIDPTIPCNYNLSYGNITKNITTQDGSFWSNGLFHVTRCETLDGKKCANNNYFKTLTYFNHSCVIWNYNGDLYGKYSHVDIEFKFDKPIYLKNDPIHIIAVPHDHEIQEIDITNRIDIQPTKQYKIKLDKTIVKRLPWPYPSNCTRDKTGDIFPGKYTRRACIESHNFIEMYKKCGVVPDYIRQFIPKNILHAYRKNVTIAAAKKCMLLFGQGETRKTLNCAFPCEYLDLSLISTFSTKPHYVSNRSFHVHINYQNIDNFKIIEEKVLYKLDQLACEIGGLLGLVLGASIISFIEILVYIFLLIIIKLF